MKSKVARIFKALSCDNRLKILKILSEGERCFGEISRSLNVDTSTISRHVSELSRMGLISVRKEGSKKVLSLADRRVLKLLEIAESIGGEIHAKTQGTLG